MFLKKNYKIIIALFLVILIAYLSIVMSSSGGESGVVSNGISQVLSPVQRVVSSFGNAMRNLFLDHGNEETLRAEIEELKQEINILQSNLIRYEETLIENNELRSMLQFKEQETDIEMMGAEVIAKDAENWYGIITIDKGLRDGVAENMPIISEYGFVGRIIEVSETTSKVMLITDERSSISILVQQNRDGGVRHGAAYPVALGQLKLAYLPETTTVQPGDTIITSGQGGIVPKGFHIGTVQSIHEEPLSTMYYAVVEPETDIQKLEKVFIVTNMSEEVEDGLE